MGISHPLSDEYDALRGAVLLPDKTPPSSPPSSCRTTQDDYLEHQISRMDTLVGIAIKYGVEISDIKRANSLVTDGQMFAHKTLIIPLPGRPIPPSVRLNGSARRTKSRAWAPNHQLKRDTFDYPDSPRSGRQGTSPAMSTLQRYYGLTSHKGNTMDCSTEMSVYHKNDKSSFQRMASERLLDSSAAPTDRSWDCDGATAAKSNEAGKPRQDGSMRRRQKVEADCMSNSADAQDDFLADPVKSIKSLLPRPISSIRLNWNSSSADSNQKSNSISFESFLTGFRSVRKSPSAPNFADAENGTSMWSSTTWTLNHESFTRPLLDGLPKPVLSASRTKTAMD